MPTQQVKAYTKQDEMSHTPGEDPLWQESIFVAWYDVKSGIGGVHHWGHEPNKGGANCWFGLMTADGRRFKRTETDVPVDHLAAKGLKVEKDSMLHQFYFDGAPKIRVRDEGVKIDLELANFYPLLTNFRPRKADAVIGSAAPDHFECSGPIRGTVEIGDEKIAIDGWCVRDHSWGIRHWNRMLNCRWICGSFGPDLSFHAILWHSKDASDRIERIGYIAENDKVTFATHVDSLMYLEPDGLTMRGGYVRWDFADRDSLELECKKVDAVIFEHHDKYTLETMTSVEHNGRQGFCIYETTTNAMGGKGPVSIALNANRTEGASAQGQE